MIFETTEREVTEFLMETSKILAEYQKNNINKLYEEATETGYMHSLGDFAEWLESNYGKSDISLPKSVSLDYNIKKVDCTKSFFENKSGILSIPCVERLVQDVQAWKKYTDSYTMFRDPWVLKEAAQNGTHNIINSSVGKFQEIALSDRERWKLSNIFNRYYIDNNPSQPGYDVESINLITGKRERYQVKAYRSKNTPDLKNTTQDIKVVVNKEHVDAVEKLGYETIPFGDNDSITAKNNKRMEKAAKGLAKSEYTFGSVVCAMAQAGVIGGVVCATEEAIVSYRQYKSGHISKLEYIEEIAKAGAEGALTGSITAGIMIPVSALLSMGGVTALLSIPIAFLVSNAVNKIIAPIFGRGEYREILCQAQYYRDLVMLQNGLANVLEQAAIELKQYSIMTVDSQQNFDFIKNKSDELKKRKLEDYNLIHKRNQEYLLMLSKINTLIDIT